MNKLPLGNEELICSWGNDLSEVVEWDASISFNAEAKYGVFQSCCSLMLQVVSLYPCTLVSLFVKALLWSIKAWTHGTWDKSEQQAAAIKRVFTNLVC